MRYHQIARVKRRDDPVTLPVIAHNASTSTPASPTDDDDADVLSEVFGVALRDSSSDDQGSATSQAIRACEHPTLARMLASFKDVMLAPSEPFRSDLEYMRLHEARLLVVNSLCQLTVQLQAAHSRYVSREDASGQPADCCVKRTSTDEHSLVKTEAYLSRVLRAIDSVIELRLEATTSQLTKRAFARRASEGDKKDVDARTSKSVNKRKGSHALSLSSEPALAFPAVHVPRLHALCVKYGLTRAETTLLHIVVIMQGSCNPYILSNVLEEDYIKRILATQRLAQISETEIEGFCDPERLHCKEGIVTSEEEHGLHFNIRCSKTAVQILYGESVSSDDLLKVAQTELEAVLAEEKALRKGAVGGGATDAEDGDNVIESSDRNRSRAASKPRSGGKRAGGGASVAPRQKRPRTSQSDVDVDDAGYEDGLEYDESYSDEEEIDEDGELDDADFGVPPEGTQLESELSEDLRDLIKQGVIDRNMLLTMLGNTPLGTDKAKLKQLVDDLLEGDKSRSRDSTEMLSAVAAANVLDAEGAVGLASTQLGPYYEDDQLEYLEEGFKIVALMIRTNAARLKDDMKKEGTKVTTWDGSEVRGARRELQAKMLLSERRMDRRIAATRKACELHSTAQQQQQQQQQEQQDPRAAVVVTQSHHVDAGALLAEGEFDVSQLAASRRRGKQQLHKGEGSGVKTSTSSTATTSATATSDVSVAGRVPSLPRLEVLAERLQLDAFEKRMILLLIGKTVSPVVKALMDSVEQGTGRAVDDVLTVGQALAILCQDFKTQVANRRYFYRSGKLLSNGIISLNRSRWHQGSGDLTDQRMTLDRRVLDWVVGLDSEINELVEGSDIYEPKVDLSQVVLPRGHLTTLLQQCRSYADFTRFRESCHGLKDKMSYGNGLVILLCGKSGTGKTMTVNAIAKDLGKKVLLVDFSSLVGRRDGVSELDADLRGLFREAHMSNAVLFFDECEAVFRSRDKGGDRLLNALLTEIERHEGIVFLATNRPHDIDEAMHRRITTVIPFGSPDHTMRLQIWRNLLSFVAYDPKAESSNRDHTTNNTTSTSTTTTSSGSAGNADATHSAAWGSKAWGNRIPMDDSIDLPALAVKFELTGGFIKNAILSAVLACLSRHRSSNSTCLPPRMAGPGSDGSGSGDNGTSASSGPVLTQEDLVAGCRLQMRSAMSLAPMDDKMVPERGLDSLHLPGEVRAAADSVVRHEKARSVVFGSWMGRAYNATPAGSMGASAASASSSALFLPPVVPQRACICALAGPRGSGKRSLVRAVSYDLGRPVRFVHAAAILSASSSSDYYQGSSGGGIGSGGGGGGLGGGLESLLLDARLSEGCVAIDAFEHILADDGGAGGVGGDGWKLHLLLSRLMDMLSEHPGVVFLICHMENPQNICLQRDFASKLYAFIRMPTNIFTYAIRAKLWESLMPVGALVASDVSFTELGRRFNELNAGSISAAVRRACAEAAYRDAVSLLGNSPCSNNDATTTTTSTTTTTTTTPTATATVATTVAGAGAAGVVRMRDLVAAGEVETAKQRGQLGEISARLFT